ncbi:hypothetical protein MTR_3g063060 [Medicago truncatula]|uniref:Uncharacterized protein n=1 Tax=Medicago truncatula TaxID=3880 RepID=A0A072V8M7_MEDTR|nr:hypothetical protein MTR_3g063060 [Medicago truncatula]
MYHQPPEQSSRHRSSFEPNTLRSITRTKTKNKTNQFRGRPDDLRPTYINIPETSENQSQNHELNQFQTCLNPYRGMSSTR